MVGFIVCVCVFVGVTCGIVVYLVCCVILVYVLCLCRICLGNCCLFGFEVTCSAFMLVTLPCLRRYVAWGVLGGLVCWIGFLWGLILEVLAGLCV